MNTELNYSASVWGGSTRYLDADVYPGPIVLLAEESDYEVLEDGFKDDAELIGTVGTANLYLISENHFDFN